MDIEKIEKENKALKHENMHLLDSFVDTQRDLIKVLEQKKDLLHYINEARMSLITSIEGTKQSPLNGDKAGDLCKMYLNGILLGLTSVQTYLLNGGEDVDTKK